MSSTRDPKARKGGKRDKKKDFFRTPYAPVASLLNALEQHGQLPMVLRGMDGDQSPAPMKHWLEAGAGDGGIIKAVDQWLAWRNDGREKYFHHHPAWTAVEIQKRFERRLDALDIGTIIIGDYLKTSLGEKSFDLSIGNPPFSLARAFVERGLHQAKSVAQLLRLNWAGSQKRYMFMREHPPEILVQSKRPSFEVTEKRDSVEYAWFLWGEIAKPGHFEVLPP